MKRTIYLPDELNQQVEEYLQLHRKSLSALVQEALEERVRPRNIGALLKLSGIVKKTRARPRDPRDAIERPEDQVVIE